MERRPTYEQLENNEVASRRPSDEGSVVMSSAVDGERKPAAETSDGGRMMEPPSYSVAAELPTYDEYEQTKRLEEEETMHQPLERTELTEVDESNKNMERIIGTDSMFIVGFIFSFLFNWLGLLIAFCVMHTCAGRFGALAGFGLSIVKWVLIVKSNEWATGVAEQDSWIWWLMIAFGMLITSSGFLHYIRIKQKWSRKNYTFII